MTARTPTILHNNIHLQEHHKAPGQKWLESGLSVDSREKALAFAEDEKSQKEEPRDWDCSVKIVLAGASGSGKTAFLNFLRGTPTDQHVATDGVDYFCVTYKRVRMAVWDTASVDPLGNLINVYFDSAQALIVFMPTDNAQDSQLADGSVIQEFVQKHAEQAIFLVHTHFQNAPEQLAIDLKPQASPLAKLESSSFHFNGREIFQSAHPNVILSRDEFLEIFTEKLKTIAKPPSPPSGVKPEPTIVKQNSQSFFSKQTAYACLFTGAIGLGLGLVDTLVIQHLAFYAVLGITAGFTIAGIAVALAVCALLYFCGAQRRGPQAANVPVAPAIS